jgi:hypothetical protein
VKTAELGDTEIRADDSDTLLQKVMRVLKLPMPSAWFYSFAMYKFDSERQCKVVRKSASYPGDREVALWQGDRFVT